MALMGHHIYVCMYKELKSPKTKLTELNQFTDDTNLFRPDLEAVK